MNELEQHWISYGRMKTVLHNDIWGAGRRYCFFIKQGLINVL